LCKEPGSHRRPEASLVAVAKKLKKEHHHSLGQVATRSLQLDIPGGEGQQTLQDEKAPYAAKDEKLKAEYTKKIHAYNNPHAGEASRDSDKSKSEVNDEDDDREGDA
ncbi:hypothetical protein ZWY2020_041845, partial [Hordeum vulgare]